MEAGAEKRSAQQQQDAAAADEIRGAYAREAGEGIAQEKALADIGSTKSRSLTLMAPRLQRRALAKSLDYCREAFDDAKIGMVAAYAAGDYTMQAIADAFQSHSATVRRAVSGKQNAILQDLTPSLPSW